jgi:hypothetical protein
MQLASRPRSSRAAGWAGAKRDEMARVPGASKRRAVQAQGRVKLSDPITRSVHQAQEEKTCGLCVSQLTGRRWEREEQPRGWGTGETNVVRYGLKISGQRERGAMKCDRVHEPAEDEFA